MDGHMNVLGTKIGRSLLACALSACGAMPMPVLAQQGCGGAASITATYATWMESYRHKNLAGTMAIFAPDIVFSFQGSPDAGYAQLRDSYKQEFSAKTTSQWIPTFEQPTADATLGVLVSRWRLVSNGRDRVHNRGLDVLRCTDGAWRIFRSMNYTEWQAKPSANTK